METIHFSTDGVVGINLSVQEQSNGDLRLLRVYQSAIKPREPDVFCLRAQERQDLRDYLARRRPGEKPAARNTTLITANGTPDDLADALGSMADAFFAEDERKGVFDNLGTGPLDFRDAYRVGVVSALEKLFKGQLQMGVIAMPSGPTPKASQFHPRVELMTEMHGAATVCAVNDATDEEILVVCNKALRRMPGWCRVVREGSNVPTVLWPRPCPEYPDRIHYVVLAE